jgi:hypothetical protein
LARQRGREERVSGHVDAEAGRQQDVLRHRRRTVVEPELDFSTACVRARHLAHSGDLDALEARHQPRGSSGASAAIREHRPHRGGQAPERVGCRRQPATYPPAHIGRGQREVETSTLPTPEPHDVGAPHEDFHLRSSLVEQGSGLERALATPDDQDAPPAPTCEVDVLGGVGNRVGPERGELGRAICERREAGRHDHSRDPYTLEVRQGERKATVSPLNRLYAPRVDVGHRLAPVPIRVLDELLERERVDERGVPLGGEIVDP